MHLAPKPFGPLAAAEGSEGRLLLQAAAAQQMNHTAAASNVHRAG